LVESREISVHVFFLGVLCGLCGWIVLFRDCTMKIPYQLRWLPTSAPATAFLLPGGGVEDVLRVCVEIGVEPLPAVFAVAGGFLLMLPGPSEKVIVGAVRLRGLAEHLLLPVNAELIPPLLADESAALVRKRGLIFLPGSRVLEFDPAAQIALPSLVQLGPVRHPDCRALPQAPMLADAIVEMTMVGIDTTPEQIIEQGGEGIGSESPSPQVGGVPSKLAGNALFQLGKGLSWLGSALHSPKLAGLGAKLLGGAMSLMPSLSEKLMGAQEAMLRELLKQFRAGNIEDALKRALPLGADPARGSGFAQNANLPTHNLFYSLINLLAGSGGGPGALWQTRDQTYYELLNEYRKQAELAVSRGDFRRAAFIHAKLLNDFHAAARILAQGGLHRDAAILYEKKLQNLALAAKEWEAAGEIDRAVQLYRKFGDHLSAGDLLRRIGAEDRAVEEYQIAAAKLLEAGPRHYEAGELLRVRGQRPDLARPYYEQGWQGRPAGSALSCATRLVQQDAEAGKVKPFLVVLSEAEAYLDARDPQTTAGFLTEIARLARTSRLAPIADEVHDRALLGIARKMKQNLTASPGQVRGLANMLKDSSVWPVPLVGDSEYALQRASKRSMLRRTVYPSVQVGRSTVTAVCQLPIGNELFLGFENGDVVGFQSATNAVQLLTREGGPIRALAVDPNKTHLLILSDQGPDKVCLRTVSCEIGYRSIANTLQTVQGPPRLATSALNSQAVLTLLQHGSVFCYFTLPNLVGTHSFEIDFAGSFASAVFHGTFDPKIYRRLVIPIVNGMADIYLEGRVIRSIVLGWEPGAIETNTLKQPPLHVVQIEPGLLQITGLDDRGGLHRSTFYLEHGDADTLSFRGSERYSAFGCVRSDLLAGVHINGIDWWTPGRVKPVQTKAAFTNPVAALPLPDAGEVLIVEADGKLTRVPVAE
jgi:tetratricopeptide (TPR) repeat protein